MNYVFFGTPEFAAIVLERLIGAGLPPGAVVTNPDRPVGRKKIVTPPPVKVVAESHHDLGIRILQPETLAGLPAGRQGFDAELKKLEPDFCVVAAYAKLIPPSVLALPRLGTIGVHPSLLPRYRGSSPIQSVIRAGEEKTGVTLFLVDAKIDHGEIISTAEHPLSGTETYRELEKTLAELGADLLIRTLPEFVAGKITPAVQDESHATLTTKIRTEDARVDLVNDDPIVIERKVRALNPEPGVWTMHDGRRMKIHEAKIVGGKLIPTVIQYDGEKSRKVN